LAIFLVGRVVPIVVVVRAGAVAVVMMSIIFFVGLFDDGRKNILFVSTFAIQKVSTWFLSVIYKFDVQILLFNCLDIIQSGLT
jgi:hypothetical protein